MEEKVTVAVADVNFVYAIGVHAAPLRELHARPVAAVESAVKTEPFVPTPRR